jgi:FKBP-type peptidyl-prolyl cis-trans isomerase FkpA
MKKFWLVGLILVVGIGVLVMVSSESPGTNKDEPGDAFPNVKEGEYVTAESGLKYRDVKVGDGQEAKTGSRVTVHYTGWLTSGKKFDSSRDRNEPYSLTLPGEVIDGWNEGIPGMKVGGKRILVIPPELGYGGRRKGDIPPNSELIFAVELLEVK